MGLATGAAHSCTAAQAAGPPGRRSCTAAGDSKIIDSLMHSSADSWTIGCSGKARMAAAKASKPPARATRHWLSCAACAPPAPVWRSSYYKITRNWGKRRRPARSYTQIHASFSWAIQEGLRQAPTDARPCILVTRCGQPTARVWGGGFRGSPWLPGSWDGAVRRAAELNDECVCLSSRAHLADASLPAHQRHER
jgi:hypothetical protein